MSEIAKRSQSALPECMAPDGAEPCRGYSHLYLSALNVEKNLNNRIAHLESLCREVVESAKKYHAIPHDERSVPLKYIDKLRKEVE